MNLSLWKLPEDKVSKTFRKNTRLLERTRDRGAGGAGGASAPPIILKKNNKRAPGRFQVGTGTPLFPVTPEQVYRRICFETLDLIVSSIEERFDQPSFKASSNMESLLIGASKTYFHK